MLSIYRDAPLPLQLVLGHESPELQELQELCFATHQELSLADLARLEQHALSCPFARSCTRLPTEFPSLKSKLALHYAGFPSPPEDLHRSLHLRGQTLHSRPFPTDRLHPG